MIRILLKRVLKKIVIIFYRKIIASGFIFRPLVRKLWTIKKINLGDRNSNFVCWGWETVDITDADYITNFHAPNFPFKNESCAAIYSSAMIEHISDESCKKLFSEIYRILTKNGSFRVVCPDLDKIIGAYRNKDHYYFLSNSQWLFNSIEEGKIPKDSFLLHNNVIRTLASYIDTGGGPIADLETFDKKFNELDKYEFAKWCVSLFKQDDIDTNRNIGHINAFDFNKLKRMLEEAGFRNVSHLSAKRYDNIIFKKPEFDKIEDRLEWLCLYVEATK